MPNLYGDILSDMCAGLVGGLGLTPSGNMGNLKRFFLCVVFRSCKMKILTFIVYSLGLNGALFESVSIF